MLPQAKAVASELLPGLFSITVDGFVNLFVISSAGETAVIDAGVPGCGDSLMRAIRGTGIEVGSINHILITHCHNDHVGGMEELKAATDATTFMHRTDAQLVRIGETMRPVSPAPTPVGRAFYRERIKNASATDFEINPVEIDQVLEGGERLEVVGGIDAIHVPGHSAGQLAFLWRAHGGVLFAADSAANAFELGLSPVYEDLDLGLSSLRRLGALTFEVACFGHGRPILQTASTRFAEVWPPADPE